MFARFEDPRQWCGRSGGVQPLAGERFERDQAQTHALWFDAAGTIRARCSLWWLCTPTFGEQRVGAIGHYAADDSDSGMKLLQAACGELKRAGCDLAVGPMDGNTWRTYRFTLDRDGAQTYFLEPDHPDEWPTHFTRAGFAMLAEYRSTVCNDLAIRDPRVDALECRLAAHGVTVRPLATERLREELRAIHSVSLEAFAHAFLYQPIAFDELYREYQPMFERLDPALVLLAERDGEIVGFAFGVPDWCQAARGVAVDTTILKTLATRPQRPLGGLGLLLMQRLHDAARRRGMRRVIHALIHEDNRLSLALSRHYAEPMRRYGLFARELC